ncbi:hypothetical protein BDZ97DRAFT_1769592 [Flammula alnicola]|nr:hypothetical protein BDZ97DRAFT_1769592 [Flammula alnicola]
MKQQIPNIPNPSAGAQLANPAAQDMPMDIWPDSDPNTSDVCLSNPSQLVEPAGTPSSYFMVTAGDTVGIFEGFHHIPHVTRQTEFAFAQFSNWYQSWSLALPNNLALPKLQQALLPQLLVAHSISISFLPQLPLLFYVHLQQLIPVSLPAFRWNFQLPPLHAPFSLRLKDKIYIFTAADVIAKPAHCKAAPPLNEPACKTPVVIIGDSDDDDLPQLSYPRKKNHTAPAPAQLTPPATFSAFLSMPAAQPTLPATSASSSMLAETSLAATAPSVPAATPTTPAQPTIQFNGAYSCNNNDSNVDQMELWACLISEASHTPPGTSRSNSPFRAIDGVFQCTNQLSSPFSVAGPSTLPITAVTILTASNPGPSTHSNGTEDPETVYGLSDMEPEFLEKISPLLDHTSATPKPNQSDSAGN